MSNDTPKRADIGVPPQAGGSPAWTACTREEVIAVLWLIAYFLSRCSAAPMWAQYCILVKFAGDVACTVWVGFREMKSENAKMRDGQ